MATGKQVNIEPDVLLHGHKMSQKRAKCRLQIGSWIPPTWYLLLVTGHQVILPALYSFLLLKCIRNHSAATLATLGRHHMSIRWPCSGHTTMPILHHGISHPVLVPLTHVTTSSNPLKLLFIQGVVYCRNLHAKCKTSLIQTFWSCCDTCICKCMMHPVSICDPLAFNLAPM